MTLYEKLKEYGESDHYPYHMPGHKRKEYLFIPGAFAGIDITEIDGFDNLHAPEGIIKEAQEFAAKCCGADHTYFLVGGSTAGVLAGISAALPYGGKLLMVRNSHRSAYNAAGLRGLKTSYIYPGINKRYGFCEAVTPDQVEEALNKEQGVGAVFIVSPTYEGRLADVCRIAEIVHSRDIPLIVDEAHGAHLNFADGCEGYGISAIRAGADIVIQSAHKTLPAPTMTALIHLNEGRVKREKLEMFLRIYQSSSPSYPLMAGLDGAVRLMDADGKRLLNDLRDRCDRLVIEISEKCKNIEVLPPKPGVQDIGKLVISSIKAGMNGSRLADILRREYLLETEMRGERYVLAMLTVADRDEAFERLKNALISIDEGIESGEIPAGASENASMTDDSGSCFEETFFLPEARQALKISEMWEKPTATIDLKESAGCISAEFVNPYPPGTPILVPGELILQAHLDCIERMRKSGLNVVGATGGRIEVLV